MWILYFWVKYIHAVFFIFVVLHRFCIIGYYFSIIYVLLVSRFGYPMKQNSVCRACFILFFGLWFLEFYVCYIKFFEALLEEYWLYCGYLCTI